MVALSAMKALKPSSPIRLIARIAAGGLLIVAAITCVLKARALRYPICGGGFWPVLWANRLGFLFIFLPFIVGVVIWGRANERLRSEIRSGVWSEEQLEPIRRFFEHSAWTAFVVLCLLGMVATLAFSHHHVGPQYWVCFFLLQVFSQLRISLKRKATGPEGIKDWQAWAPVRSDHWGEAADSAEHLQP